MIQWLYRYVFRGIGILFLIGILTGLFLMMHAARRTTRPTPAAQKGARP